MQAFRDFASAVIQTGETSIFVRWGGSGPPLLLLHGFPETHLMWRHVAMRLCQQFTIVCADLRGYGQSHCPRSAPDHGPYAKRAMARDLVIVMDELEFSSFSIAGHDRGGRVAYRLALDHPTVIERIAVLDVIPVVEAWERADARLAKSFWPWSLLAQPEPLPERLLAGAPDAIIENALSASWGSPAGTFEPAVRAEYVKALSRPESIHAICEEYRAAASIDIEHDAEDRRSGRRVTSPMLVLWSESGPLGTWYDDAGGPLGIWQPWCVDVRGRAVAAGHFFPEEIPAQTASLLQEFFATG